METNDQPPSWQELERLLQTGDLPEMAAYLASLPAGETVWAVSRLSDEEQSQLLALLTPEDAAELIQQLPDVQAVELIEELAPGAAADIIEELPSDQQADILGDLDERHAEAILTQMEPDAAHDARQLSQYDDDVAGGLMVREFLAFPSHFTVAQVIQDLRANAERYRNYQVQYAFVTQPGDRLVGVLRLRDLLLASPSQPIDQTMVRDPLTVSDTATLNELRDLLDRHQFFGIPVTDSAGTLLGIVRRSAVDEALADRNADDYRKAQGIVREELRSMPLLLRSRRRLAWLTINIGLNAVAASVIAAYQDTLAQVISLAVFLPIISDMSGCSGNQAVAVSMREMSLGLVRPNEMLRVWGKEVAVGILNGLALGLLIALAVWLWQGNVWLGAVVGTALAVNTLIAVSLGGTLPLAMRRMKMDPALASGPILTTVTDMCGFFLALSLAAAMLQHLKG